MSVYAPVPAFADQKRHPRALFLIVAGHAAVIAAVMMAKSYVPIHVPAPPTIIDLIEEQKPPPDNPPPPKPHEPVVDDPITVVPVPRPTTDSAPLPLPLPLPDPGIAIDPGPVKAIPPTEPVRVGPRFATPGSDVKPPYPQSKIRSEEEAMLRLRLSIDERGRVTRVDAVGRADPVFLAAARRHLIAHWRYKPATEDGRPVATSTVVTLRFELD